MKRQEFSDGPDMLCDTSGHCRCGPPTDRRQTCMRGTKIIDRPNQVHAMLQGQRLACQRPPTARQRGQPPSDCCIQPLHVGRIDDPVALRAPSERLDACRRAINNAAFGLDRPSPLVALDDLGDQDMAPWTQPGASTCQSARAVGRAACPIVFLHGPRLTR